MVIGLICKSCQKVVFVKEEDWPWPADRDLWAMATSLKLECPRCPEKGNFSQIMGGSLEELKKIAKDQNLVWDPSPEFGKKEGRDYIRAIGNLITEKGG